MKTLKAASGHTQSDFTQIDLALTGNQQAYRTLFKRYWKRVLFTVHRIIPDKEEARDVTMEAFTKVFFNLHRFRKEYTFSTWLYRVAVNHSLDYLRRKRLPTTPLSAFFAEDTGEYGAWGNKQVARNQNPEEQFIGWQKRTVIEGHLRALPAPLGDVAHLRFVEAYSYEEIAGKLRVPMGTVKAHIYRSRLLLQKSLKPWCS